MSTLTQAGRTGNGGDVRLRPAPHASPRGLKAPWLAAGSSPILSTGLRLNARSGERGLWRLLRGGAALSPTAASPKVAIEVVD